MSVHREGAWRGVYYYMGQAYLKRLATRGTPAVCYCCGLIWWPDRRPQPCTSVYPEYHVWWRP